MAVCWCTPRLWTTTPIRASHVIRSHSTCMTHRREIIEAGLISRPIDDVAALRDGSILLSGADHYTQRQDDAAGGEYMIDLYRPWAVIFDLKTGSLDDVAAPRTVYPGTVGLQDGRVLFAGGAPLSPRSRTLGFD